MSYLLVFGELPDQAQLDTWVHDITHHTFVHENVKQFLEGFRYDAHPMGMLQSGIAALSTFYPEAKDIQDEENRYLQIVRLIAKMPTLGAWAFRHSQGKPFVYPNNELSYSANFLSMLFTIGGDYEPGPAHREGAGRALHPARRPRAELLDQRGAQRRLVAGRPVLGRRRPASAPSTARCTAAPTRPCCGCSAASRRWRTSRPSWRASRRATSA